MGAGMAENNDLEPLPAAWAASEPPFLSLQTGSCGSHSSPIEKVLGQRGVPPMPLLEGLLGYHRVTGTPHPELSVPPGCFLRPPTGSFLPSTNTNMVKPKVSPEATRPCPHLCTGQR